MPKSGKKGKKTKKKDEVTESATVAALGLDFSDEEDEGGWEDPTADTGEAPLPAGAEGEAPIVWGGKVGYTGALPLSTWPGGGPQRRGPIAKYASPPRPREHVVPHLASLTLRWPDPRTHC